jgi:hypothetical protein
MGVSGRLRDGADLSDFPNAPTPVLLHTDAHLALVLTLVREEPFKNKGPDDSGP